MFLPVWSKLDCKVLQKFQYILCTLPFFLVEKQLLYIIYFPMGVAEKEAASQKMAANAK